MDLEHRGLADFANLVLNRYLDLTDEDDGLAAMPLFLSSRAAIRAHVTAAAMERAAQPGATPEMGPKRAATLSLLSSFCGRDLTAWWRSVALAEPVNRLSLQPSRRASVRGSCAVT